MTLCNLAHPPVSDFMFSHLPTSCSLLITLAFFPFLKHVRFTLASGLLHLLFSLPGTCFPRSLNSWRLLIIPASAPVSVPLGSPPFSHSHILALHCYLHGPVAVLYFPVYFLPICASGRWSHDLHPASNHRYGSYVDMCVGPSLSSCLQVEFRKLDSLNSRPSGLLLVKNTPVGGSPTSAGFLGDFSLGCPDMITLSIFLSVTG